MHNIIIEMEFCGIEKPQNMHDAKIVINTACIIIIMHTVTTDIIMMSLLIVLLNLIQATIIIIILISGSACSYRTVPWKRVCYSFLTHVVN